AWRPREVQTALAPGLGRSPCSMPEREPGARAWMTSQSIASVGDAKVWVIARETAPPDVDRVDARRSRAAVSPPDELFDFLFVPLGEHFDGAVRPVLDPSGEAEAPRLALRRCPKIHPLDPSPDVEMHLLQRHRCHFLAKSCQTGNFGRWSRDRVGGRGS